MAHRQFLISDRPKLFTNTCSASLQLHRVSPHGGVWGDGPHPKACSLEDVLAFVRQTALDLPEPK